MIYRTKSIISCDSPSNLSITRTKSRSRSRSHSHSRSRSNSESTLSSELEVDSPPPPPRNTQSPLIDIQHVSIRAGVKCLNILNQFSSQSKKSEAFSVSALLRDDQPKVSKSPASNNNSFETMRFVHLIHDLKLG